MAQDFAGRSVLVTGGTRGIGRVIADRYLEHGARVMVCGRKEPEPWTGELRPSFLEADVRDPDQAAAVVDATATEFGSIDIVINNAGGSPEVPAAESSPRLARAVAELNLLAPFYVAQRAQALMTHQPEGGLIINIGSVAGLNPAPGTAIYAAAKAGVTVLTKALAREWAPRVRVNQVTVGLMQNEFAHLVYGEGEPTGEKETSIPMGRMASPQDIAAACLLLSSPQAAYINGTDLLVDGGGELPAWFVNKPAG
ncbi:MAG: SDR family oxidoreductase [Actinomycetota bacterium]